MFSGFYTAASGLLTQQHKINVLTNNFANLKTPGFRASRVVTETFNEELVTRMEGGKQEVIGSSAPINVVRDVLVDFENGALEATGRSLDFALDGMGYFCVNQPAQTDEQGQETTPAQLLFTRNGSFEIDADGYLTSKAGRVLGERGEIYTGGANFTVTENGEIYGADGRYIDKLLLARPQDEQQLTMMPNGNFLADADALNTMQTSDAKVYQGHLEQANIDVNREYTLVMEAQRALQSCSQALKIVDVMNQKASTQIASL